MVKKEIEDLLAVTLSTAIDALQIDEHAVNDVRLIEKPLL
ncbi:hypothetical protein ABID96_001099 [Bacillus sp. OAE603]